MNISKKLEELWMIKLPKTKEINGFSDVVTFVIPDEVQEILQEKYQLQDYPDIAIIRRWRVKRKWQTVRRQVDETKLSYSLAYYDVKEDKFKVVVNNTWKHVKRVLGSIVEYVTSNGDLFTAEKYFSSKKAQD